MQSPLLGLLHGVHVSAVAASLTNQVGCTGNPLHAPGMQNVSLRKAPKLHRL